MTVKFTESVVEQAALTWLEDVGWQVRNGTDIGPGEPATERNDYGHVVLARRLREALARLNANEGDVLFLTDAADGSFRLTAGDPSFADKMAIAEKISRRYRNTLRELAK